MTITKLYQKFYTVKEWNKFSIEIQEELVNRYTVILTDYKTKKEKVVDLLKKLNAQNMNKGIDKMDMAFKKLDDLIKQFDQGLKKI